jgi:MerR family regulatory protein
MKNPSITANDTSNIVWIDDEAQSGAHCNRTVAVPDHGEFTIGELAREFGVTLRALRFYESRVSSRRGARRTSGSTARATALALPPS